MSGSIEQERLAFIAAAVQVLGWERDHAGKVFDAGKTPDALFVQALHEACERIVARKECGTLTDYATGESIRPATSDEHLASVAAAERDGGAGVILVDGRSAYVADEEGSR